MVKYLDSEGLSTLWERIQTLANINGIEYIVGTQDEATNAWEGTSKDKACGNGTLYTGKVIVYHLPVAGTSTAATLNLTLPDGTTTGAKDVHRLASSTVTTTFAAGCDIFMVYNGTRWKVSAYYDANTNTIGYQLRSNSYSKAMTDVTYRYRLLFSSADNSKWTPANTSSSTNATSSRTVCQTPINPFGEIVYYGTTASVAAGSRPSAAALWQQYTLSLGYSFNRTGAALELTSWKPVYVKCAPQANGSAIIDSTTPYVQDLPSTEDGKIYIFLGVAYSATAIELLMNHPVFYYKDGAIRQWNNAAETDFVVDFVYDENEEDYVCSKTYSEITAALAANRKVVGVAKYNNAIQGIYSNVYTTGNSIYFVQLDEGEGSSLEIFSFILSNADELTTSTHRLLQDTDSVIRGANNIWCSITIGSNDAVTVSNNPFTDFDSYIFGNEQSVILKASVTYNSASYSHDVLIHAKYTGTGAANRKYIGITPLEYTNNKYLYLEFTNTTASGKVVEFYSKPSTGIPSTDLASAVQTSLGKADTALQSYTETDPVFTASAAHGITATDIANWNAKQDSLANTQNPYTAQGTSTKVPTITTNNLGQVTTITETNIAFPTLSKGTTSGSGNAVTDISVSGHTITLTKGSTFGTYSKPSGGIPSTDLASAVQASLGKADAALLPDVANDIAQGSITSSTGQGFDFIVDSDDNVLQDALDAKASISAVNAKQDTLVSGTNIKTVNNTSLLGSGNVSVGTITGITMNGSSKGTSGVVDLGTVLTAHQDISGKADKSDTYTKTEVNNLIPSIQQDIVVGALPTTGSPNTIYRVPSTSSYTDWAWDGTQWVELATYNNAIDDVPTQGSNNLVKSGGVYSNTAIIENNNEDIFSIEDNIGAKILSVTNSSSLLGAVEIDNGGNEGDFLIRRSDKWTPESVTIPPMPDITTDTAQDNVFTIEDGNEDAALKISANGFEIGKFPFILQSPQNGHGVVFKDGAFLSGKGDWAGKILALYGDSVVAIGNGDFVRPYTINSSTSWGVFTANFLGLSKYYGRGIGGQSFKWGTGGGSVSWVRPDGRLINRLDAYNYDSWNALDTKVYPTGVTADMITGGTAITIRGCGCSWLRITTMFPALIKDEINAVVIMYHNDAATSYPDFSWIDNDATDAEWAADSTYYLGGDYNISTTKGAIASTIMKMQAWMPNAVIILATPISGRGTTGQLKPTLIDSDMQGLADAVIDMGRVMAIPVIDVFATCGINGLNRTTFISDTIHPYTLAGNKAVARAVTGGMLNILSNF